MEFWLYLHPNDKNCDEQKRRFVLLAQSTETVFSTLPRIRTDPNL